MDYTPHTDADVAEMLAVLGVAAVDALFDAQVPAELRVDKLDLPDGMAEAEVLAHMKRLAARNSTVDDGVCWLGGGVYDHYVPAVVARGRWQARVRHGVHALPAGDEPGQPAGALRVPDPRQRGAGFARRQLQSVRRGDRGGRGGDDVLARDGPEPSARVRRGRSPRAGAAAARTLRAWVSTSLSCRWAPTAEPMWGCSPARLTGLPGRRAAARGRPAPERVRGPGGRARASPRWRTGRAPSLPCPSTCCCRACSSRLVGWGRTSSPPTACPPAIPWRSVGRAAACSPAAPRMSGGCPDGSSAAPSTSTAATPTCLRCRRASSTSAGRRRPATSAPIRRSTRWRWRCTCPGSGPQGLVELGEACLAGRPMPPSGWPRRARRWRSPAVRSARSSRCASPIRSPWLPAWREHGHLVGPVVAAPGGDVLLVAVTEQRTQAQMDDLAATVRAVREELSGQGPRNGGAAGGAVPGRSGLARRADGRCRGGGLLMTGGVAPEPLLFESSRAGRRASTHARRRVSRVRRSGPASGRR